MSDAPHCFDKLKLPVTCASANVIETSPALRATTFSSLLFLPTFAAKSREVGVTMSAADTVGIGVGVEVAVVVGVGVDVAVGVKVAVAVAVRVDVGVEVDVAVGVIVAVAVGVGDPVEVAVGVGVEPGEPSPCSSKMPRP